MIIEQSPRSGNAEVSIIGTACADMLSFGTTIAMANGSFHWVKLNEPFWLAIEQLDDRLTKHTRSSDDL